MKIPIELRGHHIESIAFILKGTFLEHAEDLLYLDYVPSKDDPFVKYSYEYPKQLFSDPEQQFLIISERPDFFCNACNKKRKCFDENGQLRPVKRFMGKAFAIEEEEAIREKSDSSIARKYGFESGKVYSAREIREKMNF